MKTRKCSKCGISNLDAEFHTNSTYCKYCKSIIEAERRYKNSLEEAEDKYKFQRSFLYKSVHFKNRSLDFCAQVMGFHVEELKLALDAIGYYNNDYCWCSNCAFLKPKDKFRKANNRKKGHQDWCNDCKNRYNEQNVDYIRQYRKNHHCKNRDKHLKYSKNHYSKNRDHYLKMNQEYYFANREERNQYSRDHYQKHRKQILTLQKENYPDNRDKIRAQQSKYYQNNRDQFIFNANLRRARLLKATPKWADIKKIKKIYKQAIILENADGIKRHVDHIIPLVNNKVCGLHVENNLQILTAKENLSKNNKFEPFIKIK